MNQVKDYIESSIDNDKYKIRLLSTSRAFITGQEIAKLSLPSLGAGLDGIFNEGVWEDKQTFSEMAVLLTTKMEDVNILELIKELLSEVSCNDEKIDFERHFMGRPELLLFLIEEALGGNYGSLFTKTGLSEKWKKFTQEYKSQVPALKTKEEKEPLKESQE